MTLSLSLCGVSENQGVTVNLALLAVPPGVVTATFPVLPAFGTNAVICVPLFTV